MPLNGSSEYDLVQRLKWQLTKFPFAGDRDLADAMADQLDIVKASRLPGEEKPPKEEPKREFTHRSILEDKHKTKFPKHQKYNDAVR